MTIIEDGGGWNENISELQTALVALGADIPINGVLSNTEIVRMQQAVLDLGGTLADPDGDLGNDSIAALQHAVNLLQGGVTPVDPGPPVFDFDMRQLDDSTQVTLPSTVEVGLGTPDSGTWSVGFNDVDHNVYELDPVAFDVSEEDLQAAADAEFAPIVVTVTETAPFTFQFEFPNDYMTFSSYGGVAQYATQVSTYGARLTEWASVTGNLTATPSNSYYALYDKYAFKVSSDDVGTVVSSTADGDERMFTPFDFSALTDGFTVVELLHVTGDAPTEHMAVPTQFSGNNVEYNYLYVAPAPEDGFVISALVDTGIQRGVDATGPQPGMTYLLTQSFDPAGTRVLSHVDGPVLNPQTAFDFIDWSGAWSLGYLMGNYYSGGYGTDLDHVRRQVYSPPLTKAERLFVRQFHRDAEAGTAYEFTLRDEMLGPPPSAQPISGTITFSGLPVEGVTVALVFDTDQVESSVVTEADGTYVLTPVRAETDTYAVRATKDGFTDSWYPSPATDWGSAAYVDALNGASNVDIEMQRTPFVNDALTFTSNALPWAPERNLPDSGLLTTGLRIWDPDNATDGTEVPDTMGGPSLAQTTMGLIPTLDTAPDIFGDDHNVLVFTGSEVLICQDKSVFDDMLDDDGAWWIAFLAFTPVDAEHNIMGNGYGRFGGYVDGPADGRIYMYNPPEPGNTLFERAPHCFNLNTGDTASDGVAWVVQYNNAARALTNSGDRFANNDGQGISRRGSGYAHGWRYVVDIYTADVLPNTTPTRYFTVGDGQGSDNPDGATLGDSLFVGSFGVIVKGSGLIDKRDADCLLAWYSRRYNLVFESTGAAGETN